MNVIESILSKMSIPVISSSVAAIKLMEMKPTNATLHYLKAIFGKNYKLPKRVLEDILNYLMKFEHIDHWE